MSTGTYTVHGLRCGLCIAELMDGLRSMAGVTRVAVDLVPGGASLLAVTADTPRTEAVRDAVREAGFELGRSTEGGRRDP